MAERLGIVLAAGAVKKERLGHQIVEPDQEGKVRCLGALTDLIRGEIPGIAVSGGLIEYEKPVSKWYVDYLRRYSKRYRFHPEIIYRVRGGINTSTDLQRAIEILGKRTVRNSTVYTSGFHLKRALPRLSTLGVQAKGRATEEITSTRSHRHPSVVQRVIQEVEQRTNIHELLGRLPILLDQMPIIGNLHLGLRLEEYRARMLKKGE